MAKINEKLKFGLVGVTGAITSLAAASGGCSGAGCNVCPGCAGMALVLVSAALLSAKKGEKFTDWKKRMKVATPSVCTRRRPGG